MVGDGLGLMVLEFGLLMHGDRVASLWSSRRRCFAQAVMVRRRVMLERQTQRVAYFPVIILGQCGSGDWFVVALDNPVDAEVGLGLFVTAAAAGRNHVDRAMGCDCRGECLERNLGGNFWHLCKV